MDIAEVAEQSGVAPSALRYYESRGLIASVGRRGLRRQYAAEVLDRLALITLGRSAGLTLEEIGRMFSAGGRLRVDRQLLAAKAGQLDRRIRRLSAMRDGLQHAAACPAADHLACPKFRRLLGLAVRRARAVVAVKPGTRTVRMGTP
jgi:DNA-binding transcriptional MerR regulator